jgi:hypothetical protein
MTPGVVSSEARREGSGRRRRVIAVLALVLSCSRAAVAATRAGPTSVELVAAGGIACSSAIRRRRSIAVTRRAIPTRPRSRRRRIRIAPSAPAPATADPATAARRPAAGLTCRSACRSHVGPRGGAGARRGRRLGDYHGTPADSYRSQYDPGWAGCATSPAGARDQGTRCAPTFFATSATRPGPGRVVLLRRRVVARVVLNSNCDLAGGCGPDSPQVQWLRGTSPPTTARCTLATGTTRASPPVCTGAMPAAPPSGRCCAHHADVVLAAHEHDYSASSR